MLENRKAVLSFILALTFCLTVFLPCFEVSAADRPLGDVDGDCELTLSDALSILRYAAGFAELSSDALLYADYDGDGCVTSSDAQSVLCCAIDLETVVTDYYQHYIDIGFPKSYAEKLVALHEKYPNWEYQPFITGLIWADAVAGEHTPHNKQLIEKNVSSYMMCDCSKCDGVIQESTMWVSASEYAVAYYLDPRNFLTDRYIFQFEDTGYSKSQTTDGVEAIIKGTWMENSYITYLDASGNTVTYTEDGKKIKYSSAILKAAKDSGMSAYYLASKIRQEVGSSTSSYAGGSCGNMSPYNGIYNYYNIGAYTGALDGLKWANGYMKVTSDKPLYKTASTKTKLVTVPSGTTLYYIGESGNYYKVKVNVSSSSYTGYIKKTDVDIQTSYGRPWDNPYKTIYYGAKYIYSSYSQYQFTGYLQKFNVNAESGSLYNHEYMGNVRAAAAEAKSTYNAYDSAGILNTHKVFRIPVFSKMPDTTADYGVYFEKLKPSLSLSGSSPSGVTIKWNALDTATGYKIYKYDSSSSKYVSIGKTSSLSYTDTSVKKGETLKYKVKAYYTGGSKTVYSQYSSVLSVTVSNTASGTVNVSDSLNVRSKPSTDGDILVQLPDGTVVSLLGKTGSWYKITVTYNGKKYTGYVSSKYIDTKDTVPELESAPAEEPEVTPEKCPYTEPTSTLRSGDSGTGVKWLQWYLYKLGYLSSSGDIDGKFGSGTLSAVEKFQSDAGIDVDGVVGSGTRSALKKAYS